MGNGLIDTTVAGGGGGGGGGTTVSVTDLTSGSTLTATTDGTLKTYTNLGSSADITVTLPSASADNDPITFRVLDSDGGMIITAASGDAIKYKGFTTATAGNIFCDEVGAEITLTCEDAQYWVCSGIKRDWDLDGWRNGNAISVGGKVSTCSFSTDPFATSGTFACWATTDSVQGGSPAYFFAKTGGGSQGCLFSLHYSGTVMQMRTNVYGTGGTGNRSWFSDQIHPGLGDGKLHLFVFVVDNTDTTVGTGTNLFYFDGKRTREDGASSTVDTYVAATDYSLFISGTLLGIVHSMACWSTILTAEEVQTLWNEGVPCNMNTLQAANCEACWNFGDVAGDDDTATTGGFVDLTANSIDTTNDGAWAGTEIIPYPIIGK